MMLTLTPMRVLHMCAGLIPATLTVLFAGLIALLALGLDHSRRDYALDLAERFVELAAVLVGHSTLTQSNSHTTRPPPSGTRGRHVSS